MSIEAEDVQLITTQVWELMMGSGIARSDADYISDDEAPMVAHVSLAGAFEGRVALQAATPLVRHAAAEMFDRDRDQITDGEMEDTARELANMIGGNIKCLVEQPTELGLPEIASAPDFRRDNEQALHCLTFEHEGATLQVRVYSA